MNIGGCPLVLDTGYYVHDHKYYAETSNVCYGCVKPLHGNELQQVSCDILQYPCDVSLPFIVQRTCRVHRVWSPVVLRLRLKSANAAHVLSMT